MAAGGFHFDPDKVACFEAAGWRAYHERKWPQLLWLTDELCQTRFRILEKDPRQCYWSIDRALAAKQAAPAG